MRLRIHVPGLSFVRKPRARAQRAAIVLASLALLALLAQPPLAQQAGDEPLESALEERLDLRFVQVDVSVVDPQADSQRSVPGLSLEQFEILVDGRRLAPERLARVSFDEVCAPADFEGTTLSLADPAKAGVGELRPVVGVIDFNYLDAAGRQRVAEALDAAAERVTSAPETYKIYGLTRQLRLLTPGFTRDPAVLRAAAERVRATIWTRRQLAGLPGLGEAADASEAPPDAFGGDDVPGVEGSLIDDLQARLGDAFGLLSDEEASTFETLFGDRAPSLVRAAGSQGDYDAGASLASLEAVLRAHAHVVGRKVLVLFSTESFRLVDEDRLSFELEAIRDLARRVGFTIWTVDADALSRRGSGASELMSALSGDTGGVALRRTGRLEEAFAGASEQMACYYLFTIPVEVERLRDTRRSLVVRLDTEKHPDLWNLRVIHPSRLTFVTRSERLRDTRIAALLSPADYDTPRVEATLEYPLEIGERPVLPARFRVPLRALTWESAPGAEGVVASVLVDALVQRDTGRGSEIVCEAGSESLGGPLTLRLPRPPSPKRDAGLVVELFCQHEREGLHVARAAITDLPSEGVGAGRSTALIGTATSEALTLYEPRVQVASGRDLVWRPGGETALRDRARRAWRALGDGAEADPGDRVALRYVLCAPGEEQPALPTHALVRLDAPSGPTLVSTFAEDALTLGSPAERRDTWCAAAMVAIEPFTLEPGRYALAALAPGADPALAVRDVAASARLPEGLLTWQPLVIAP